MGMDAQQQGSWLGRFYAEATRLAVRFPQATLALALLAAGMSIVYTGMNLGYRTSRHDLLDPESDYNRHWLEYIQEFGEDDDAVVVVDGANREQVVPVLQEISEQLTHQEQFGAAARRAFDANGGPTGTGRSPTATLDRFSAGHRATAAWHSYALA